MLGIKHRDISINNLMFRRLNDGSVQGVLNDWDVASTRETESRPDHVGMRTGTRPFMSMDLHVDNPPVHMVRFDYESLLYVLYWICAAYSGGGLLPKKKRHPNAEDWEDWSSANDRTVWKTKVAFVHQMDLDETKFPEQFRPLVKSWIEPLRTLFKMGYLARTDASSEMTEDEITSDSMANVLIVQVLGPSAPQQTIGHLPQRTGFDNTTLGGHVTVNKIISILMK